MVYSNNLQHSHVDTLILTHIKSVIKPVYQQKDKYTCVHACTHTHTKGCISILILFNQIIRNNHSPWEQEEKKHILEGCFKCKLFK